MASSRVNRDNPVLRAAEKLIVKVAVVLLHRLAAIVEFLVFLSLFCLKLPSRKGFDRFFVSQNTEAIASYIC
jgi:hypothetical protein